MDTPASLLHPCLHPTGVLIRSGKTRHPFGRRTRTGRGLRPPLPCPVPKLRLGLKHANEFVSFSFCLSVSFFFFQLLCLLTFARGVQQRMSESRGTSPAARGRGVARRVCPAGPCVRPQRTLFRNESCRLLPGRWHKRVPRVWRPKLSGPARPSQTPRTAHACLGSDATRTMPNRWPAAAGLRA